MRVAFFFGTSPLDKTPRNAMIDVYVNVNSNAFRQTRRPETAA